MALDPRRFDSFVLADLEALVEAGEREGVGLEYKAQLESLNDEQKKEFLADISSLANAKGGFVIFGVEEDRAADGRPTGVPQRVVGVEMKNAEGALLKIENIARDGIEPRINGLRFRTIMVSPGREAIIAYVPVSLVGPHIVKFKGGSRFFSRNSAGKYQLAYTEIRDAFLRSDERMQRVRAFRMERLSKLVAGEALMDMGGNPMIVVHLLPLLETTVDVLTAKSLNLAPISSGGWNATLNFEGVLSFSHRPTYVQIFRDGAIEAVSGHLIKTEGQIPSYAFEDEVRNAVPRFLRAQQELGVPFPIAFCYSLLGVKGKEFALPGGYSDPPSPIPRNDLIIGETILESTSGLDSILKSAFDLVWQSCGWTASINFDKSGQWRKR